MGDALAWLPLPITSFHQRRELSALMLVLVASEKGIWAHPATSPSIPAMTAVLQGRHFFSSAVLGPNQEQGKRLRLVLRLAAGPHPEYRDDRAATAAPSSTKFGTSPKMALREQ
jgi:hypothetical protein